MTGTTLWDLVEWRAARTPDATALIQGAASARHERRITFGGLQRRAERVAAGLHDRGVRPAAGASGSCRPSPKLLRSRGTPTETVLLSLALARIGAVQSPVVPQYRDHETGHMLRRTRADCFVHPAWRGFHHRATAERLAAGLPRPRTVIETAGRPAGANGSARSSNSPRDQGS